MEVSAKAKYLRLSPRKTRLVIDLVRGKKATQALDILQFDKKDPAEKVHKLIQSAIANATNNFELDKDTLIVKKIYANQGPVLKRWKPRAFGRADMLRKPTTHITVVLEAPDKESKADAKSKDKKEDVVKGSAEDAVKGKTPRKDKAGQPKAGAKPKPNQGKGSDSKFKLPNKMTGDR